ncbi:hypothetical protein OA78_1752 [Latilactobacillus curvatus]|nr:hypothetical protein OA78_1752 [Latilactobacillus curvatus]
MTLFVMIRVFWLTGKGSLKQHVSIRVPLIAVSN